MTDTEVCAMYIGAWTFGSVALLWLYAACERALVKRSRK